jgi:hypothetical protein
MHLMVLVEVVPLMEVVDLMPVMHLTIVMLLTILAPLMEVVDLTLLVVFLAVPHMLLLLTFRSQLLSLVKHALSPIAFILTQRSLPNKAQTKPPVMRSEPRSPNQIQPSSVHSQLMGQCIPKEVTLHANLCIGPLFQAPFVSSLLMVLNQKDTHLPNARHFE